MSRAETGGVVLPSRRPTMRKMISELALYAPTTAAIAYFFAWTLMNNAGKLMVTVVNMDNCDSNGNDIQNNGNRFTTSCDALSNMTSSTRWPATPIYGCWDGLDYQKTVGTVFAERCIRSLVNKCSTLLKNAFFDASKDAPYSPDTEYVNAYGVFCEKDTSAFFAIAFIVLAVAALLMVGRSAYLIGVSFWNRTGDTESSDAADELSYGSINN